MKGELSSPFSFIVFRREKRTAPISEFFDLLPHSLLRYLELFGKAGDAHEFSGTAVDELAVKTDIKLGKLSAAFYAGGFVENGSHLFTNLALNRRQVRPSSLGL